MYIYKKHNKKRKYTKKVCNNHINLVFSKTQTLAEEMELQPKILFSTVVKPTKSQNSIGPCIRLGVMNI